MKIKRAKGCVFLLRKQSNIGMFDTAVTVRKETTLRKDGTKFSTLSFGDDEREVMLQVVLSDELKRFIMED